MANQSISAAFERFWQHVCVAINKKAETQHTHTVSDVSGLTDVVIPKTLTSEFYGDELPEAGTAGRIFFKKV